MRGHRGDYPYNCDRCKRGFFRPKLFKEHRCADITDQPATTNRVFRPRRLKRKPGRPRKVLKKMSSHTDDSKDINITNVSRNNASVLVRINRANEDVHLRDKRRVSKHFTRGKKAALKVNKSVEVKNEEVIEQATGAGAENNNDVTAVETDISAQTVIPTVSEGIVFMSAEPDSKKVRKNKPECYVKTPPASLAVSQPLSMVERYITVQLTTTNNCDGSEIQAQLIPTGDLTGQFQFPASLQAGHLELANTALHPGIQIIEGQPLTLTVSQGEQLGDVGVEHNVIDIPVDIVTVSGDQALVCTQEVTSAEGDDAAQTYTAEMEDYGAGDAVLQGAENLIDASVEIMGHETM